MNLTEHLDEIERDPLGCLIDSLPEGSAMKRRVQEQRAADAQALADVRTLDDARGCGSDGLYREPVFGPPDADGIRETFVGVGPTPDAARHAAAEWVRAQRGEP